MNKGLFTSKSYEWETPQALFDELDAEFGFTLDACATPENAKCAKYFTKEDDALSKRWKGVVFMNPPYGRQIGHWIRHAFEAAQNGDATVVCLVPARTDTAWWHGYCMKGEIRFLRGRLYFRNPGSRKADRAPFPSAIVIFGNHRRPADAR